MAKKPNYRVPLHQDWHEPILQKELGAFKIENIIDYIQKYDAEEGTKWLKELTANKTTTTVINKNGKECNVTHPTFREIHAAFVDRYFEPFPEEKRPKPKHIYDLIANL